MAFDKMEQFSHVVGEEVANARNIVDLVNQSIEITEQAAQMIDGASQIAAKAAHTAEELKRHASRFRVSSDEQERNTQGATPSR